MMQTENSASA